MAELSREAEAGKPHGKISFWLCVFINGLECAMKKNRKYIYAAGVVCLAVVVTVVLCNILPGKDKQGPEDNKRTENVQSGKEKDDEGMGVKDQLGEESKTDWNQGSQGDSDSQGNPDSSDSSTGSGSQGNLGSPDSPTNPDNPDGSKDQENKEPQEPGPNTDPGWGNIS